MKFHPILFSTAMVQAILEDRKTMTRRVIKSEANNIFWNPIVLNGYAGFTDEHGSPVKCPYGQVGDILWCRETWQYTGPEINIDPGYVYKATDPDWDTLDNWTWKPSIFMPKAACRLFLEIVDIRVERLQDITEADAVKEGIEKSMSGDGRIVYKHYLKPKYGPSPVHSFQTLWQSINGKESWEENPWVWVISFKRIEKPENFI